MWKLKFNLKAYLSTAALPGQTTKTALTEEFMFQNVAYRPTVYITGVLHFAKKSYGHPIVAPEWNPIEDPEGDQKGIQKEILGNILI